MNDTETDLLIQTISRLKPRRIETDMQDAIEKALKAGGFAFTREHRHDKSNRFDFLVETAGETIIVEVKVKGASGPDTERQLLRYSSLLIANRIIIVTTTGMRLRVDHFTAGGKRVPVITINLAMNSLA